MSCANPFYRYDRNSKSFSKIPCGWCICCRIDRKNYFSDKFEYSFYKEFGSVGAFVTITYDDNFIPMNSDFTSYTLRKSDHINFVKRLRSYIKYHNLDSPLFSKSFKYLCAGEYGDKLRRPHLHYIFCGLDFKLCQEIFPKVWHNGIIIDSRPILRGGINYVCKYLDKQQHGDQLDKYFEVGIEPPFFCSSHSLSKGLYANCKDGFYVWNRKKRPLPIWFKNKMLLQSKPVLNDKVLSFARKSLISYDEADYQLRFAKNLSMENSALSNNEPVDRVEKYQMNSLAFDSRNRIVRNSRGC